jgi:hypothetical protein
MTFVRAMTPQYRPVLVESNAGVQLRRVAPSAAMLQLDHTIQTAKHWQAAKSPTFNSKLLREQLIHVDKCRGLAHPSSKLVQVGARENTLPLIFIRHKATGL